MAWTRNAWNNFKTQPEIWFFYTFILTSPLSIRKVFFDYPILGEFNEYSGIYLYLTDIFLGLTILIWLISILYNKISYLSIGTSHSSSRLPRVTKMFHMEHFGFLRGGIKIVLLGLPALLVLWSSITIFWSDQPQIALYKSFKLFEFYLLYLFLALNPHTKTLGEKHFGVGVNPKCFTLVEMFHSDTNVPRGTFYEASVEQPTGQAWNFLRNTFCIIIAIGLINAIISISQVILQHSFGLFWLKESLISPDLPGVAKIVLGGAKYIRAYGLFPHPNILGGFLFLSIILTLAYREMFHPDTNVPHGTSYGAGMEHPTGPVWNILRGRYGTIWKILLLLQIIGLIITFSKSALVGLVSTLAYLIYIKKVPRVTASRPILEKKGLFKAFRYWEVFVIGLILGVLALILRPDLNSLFFQSLNERVLYLDIARKMILTTPLFGVGVGQFVVNMQAYTNQLLLDWQFQPVHNVFLLIWSELGLIGLSLFGWFLWELFYSNRSVPRGTFYGAGVKQEQASLDNENVPRGTFGSEHNIQNVFKALLIGFFFIALFDHYLWDIQQGQIMLWTTLGLLASRKVHT